MPRSRVKVSAVNHQDRDQIDFDNLAQAVFEWSEAVAETYGRLDKSNLPSWLARVLAAPVPHLEQCRVCQDRILRARQGGGDAMVGRLENENRSAANALVSSAGDYEERVRDG
jgi:hypothetical protein